MGASSFLIVTSLLVLCRLTAAGMRLQGSATTDEQVLCDFYNTVPAVNRAKLTNWCGTGDASSVCVGNDGTSSWLGVVCALVGGASRVTSLETSNAGVSGLGGSLPTSIGGLDALTWLDLSSNFLSGGIPSALGALTRLTSLDLYANSLSGTIPTSLGAALTRLANLILGYNSLSGSIPSALGGLTGLTHLGLYVNSLSGSIPSSLGGLTGLTYLDLQGNSLSGPVPASFCRFDPSIYLYVFSNPSLTCYPSCLLTYSSFMSQKGSLSAVCAADPPTPSPTPFPVADDSTGSPTGLPNTAPSSEPTETPSSDPSTFPTHSPSEIPTPRPNVLPPPSSPTPEPTESPSSEPSALPLPIALPTPEPNVEPTSFPIALPSPMPIATTMPAPSLPLTAAPSAAPSLAPAAMADQQVLCDFYNTMPSTGKAKLTNWCGAGDKSSVCGGNGGTSSWYGVACSVVRGASRVTRLGINNAGMSGIGGSLPTSIGGLDALTLLQLYQCGLSGNIPPALGASTGLTLLDLAGNSLSGNIPSALGDLSGLTHLGLYVNSLSGSIPFSLGALTGLTDLDLSSNSLTGPLPFSFCSLKPSIELFVAGNSGLTCYPSCLSTNSYFMNTGKGSLSAVCPAGPSPPPTSAPSPAPSAAAGAPTAAPTPSPSPSPSAAPSPSPFPSLASSPDSTALCDFYSTMSSTGKAKLTNWCGSGDASSVCGAAGTSSWLGVTCAVVGGASRVTSLDTLSAGVRALGGSLPTSIGGLDALTLLDLAGNALLGTIPSSLGALTALAVLDLGVNSLSNSIPSSLGTMTGLTYLSFAGNSLTSVFPSSLGGLTGLTFLHLDTNSFTGPIPPTFCSLKPSIDLEVFSNPGLTCYPSCLSTYPRFMTGKDASLSAVCASGPLAPSPLPSALPSAQPTDAGTAPTNPTESVDQTVLCDFYNTVPAANRAKLTNWCGEGDASSVCGAAGTSSWLGVACGVVGGASRVTSLDTYTAGVRALGGGLPTSIGGLDALTYLEVAYCSLSGSIPSEVAGLTSLSFMGLSLNALSGTIPSSLGTLTALTWLDLGADSLSGKIPSSLGGLTGLTALWLKINALTGLVPASFCNLKPTISLQLGTNPGLTCYPSCLSTNSVFMAIPDGRDASLSAVCASALTPPPSALPTLSPNVPYFGAGPTGQPTSQPSGRPSSQPALPSAVPSPSPRPSSASSPDSTALCDFYNTMPSTGKAKLTNWCGAGDKSSVCGAAGTSSWLGVTCAVVGSVSRVTSLDTCQWTGSVCAGVTSIGGSLPTSIGGLDALTTLALSSAGISGSIPSTMGSLRGLVLLVLGTNSFVGTIPFSLGALTRLAGLYLGYNSLSGSIPSSLGGLTGLTALVLLTNSLSGSIPSALGGLTGLTDLRLDSNSLSGSIPSALGGLTGLTTLWLNNNAFTSSVPPSFCGLQPKIDLRVQSNPGLTCYPSCLSINPSFQRNDSLYSCGDEQVLCDFYNTVLAANRAKLTNWCGAGDKSSVCVGAAGMSSWLGVACAVVGGVSRVTRLDTYDAGVSGIGGSLPTSIGGLDALTFFQLVYAGITGSIPSTMGALRNLAHLGLWSNFLSGSIPSSLGGLTGLSFLSLDTNSLTSGIPSSLGALTGLSSLVLDTNYLSGGIPSSLGALTGLTYLYLQNNTLTGPVPASFCKFKLSIDLRVDLNPNMTCYPSCLSTNSFFTNFGRGSLNVCPPSLPSLPRAQPSPRPSASGLVALQQPTAAVAFDLPAEHDLVYPAALLLGAALGCTLVVLRRAACKEYNLVKVSAADMLFNSVVSVVQVVCNAMQLVGSEHDLGWTDALGCILAARVLQALVTSWLLWKTLYGDKELMQQVVGACLHEPTPWVLVAGLSLLDVGNLRFFCWRSTEFSRRSGGFPTLKFFYWSLFASACQALVMTVLSAVLYAHSYQGFLSLASSLLALLKDAATVLFRLRAEKIHLIDVFVVEGQGLVVVREDGVYELDRRVADAQQALKLTQAELERQRREAALEAAEREREIRLLREDRAKMAQETLRRAGRTSSASSISSISSSFSAASAASAASSAAIAAAAAAASGAFATDTPFADKTLEILKSQLKERGGQPLEFIPFELLNAELKGLFASMNAGEPYDERRLEHLLACLEIHPEYRAAKEAERVAWRARMGPFVAESLSVQRDWTPPHISSASFFSLCREGVSVAVAKRLMSKPCLWLVRRRPADIARLHEAELANKYSCEGQGLDLVELAAVFACMPTETGFPNDPSGKKAAMLARLEDSLKAALTAHEANTLPAKKQRAPCYADDEPRFRHRTSLLQWLRAGSASAIEALRLSLARSTPRGTPRGTPHNSASTGRESEAARFYPSARNSQADVEMPAAKARSPIRLPPPPARTLGRGTLGAVSSIVSSSSSMNKPPLAPIDVIPSAHNPMHHDPETTPASRAEARAAIANLFSSSRAPPRLSPA